MENQQTSELGCLSELFDQPRIRGLEAFHPCIATTLGQGYRCLTSSC